MSTGEYVIKGRSFPMVNSVSLGDAMFVEAAARMEFEEFGSRLDAWQEQSVEGQEREMQPGDMRVLVGLLAAAVSRVERDWTPTRVARFVWDIDAESDLEIIPPDSVADADPLGVKTGESPSQPSSSDATISAADSPAGAPV